MPGPEDTYQEYGKPWAGASNTPFRLYKHFVHEGGISSPFIANWPAGIDTQGEFRRQPAHLIDVMATCVELSGAEYPATRDGRPVHPAEGVSLLPAFADQPLDREAIYWEHEGNRAVRSGRWKLVAKGPRGPWELYDLAADRTETADLADEYPDRVRDMAQRWLDWAERSHVLPWPHRGGPGPQ